MFPRLLQEICATGMTEAEVAKHLGCSQASVNRMKHGKQGEPSFSVAQAIIELHRARVPAAAGPATSSEAA